MSKYKQIYPTDMGFDRIRELRQNLEKNLAELKRIDKESMEKGTLLYRYFSTPVADGRAFYQVTKMGKKTCTLTRCAGICPDEYRDNILGDETEMSITKVKPFIEGQQAINRLFGG